jgi:hypothetical protein
MMEIICNCGHAMSEHEVVYGCLHELEDGVICHCGNEPTYIANDKLAALLAAGNTMRERLMSLRALSNEADMRGNAEGYINASTLFTQEDAAALAAWEQVTR